MESENRAGVELVLCEFGMGGIENTFEIMEGWYVGLGRRIVFWQIILVW